MLSGHVGDEAVLLVRRGTEYFAIGAACTHYGGPIAEGLLVGDTVRCPWHHACFDLRTGQPLRAPALDPLPCWRVEIKGELAVVGARLAPHAPIARPVRREPGSVVIVGGGAAGNAAAETLRREGYEGPVTIFSADTELPCDRPNLSKDYLAGKAPEEWTLLRTPDFYESHRISVRLGSRVSRIDTASRQVILEDGSSHGYGALLLATGAIPVRLEVPGTDLPHVHYLRTLVDSRALAAAAIKARKAVVIGSGFIGLEVASSLRTRGLDVTVIGREAIPMAGLLGPELGSHIRKLHERHDVKFHMERAVTGIDESAVLLDDGSRIEAGLVVIGVGARPAISLAEDAGLETDDGVMVDQFLQTSASDVYAAGDIARWPDPHSGETIRIEHFAVAERQGQTAARNMLGMGEPFDAVPFFWTEQHGLALAYVGHSQGWDKLEVDGSIEREDCTLSFFKAGRKMAAVVINRDLEGLLAEVELERLVERTNGPLQPEMAGQ
ncbi:MAG: FAD-dependent oxidoreductase [Sphingomonas sp.]|nr:FAD-dependent oxidoreductase [Sphingomonas sp.]